MALDLVAVALPTPLRRCFDYLVPPELRACLPPGVRVEVPFGRRQLIGLVVSAPRQAEGGGYQYKPVSRVLDPAPLAPPDWLKLVLWAAEYYQYPVGEVVAAALPAPLREGRPALGRQARRLGLTGAGRQALALLPARAHRQRALLSALAAADLQLLAGEASGFDAAVLRKALEQQWVEERDAVAEPGARTAAPPLSAAQQQALAALQSAPPGFSVSLLEGVTGSGKTELYLRLAEQTLLAGRQVLVLVPEIGLTPQLSARFAERFGAAVASFHSGMTEVERNDAWLAVAARRVQVLVGTRSAVFAPFADLGLVVVDEEHDASYKQQEGFRYHARDLALLRAKECAAMAVLGSATPALESLAHARSGRYRHVRLEQRISGRAPPPAQLIDLNVYPTRHGLTEPLLAAVSRHLEAGGQCLLFINRRGYAPTLLCEVCHWTAPCRHCDARMTLHRARGRLVCHHCGHEELPPRVCPSCGGARLLPVGEGTERIEDALRNHFPGHRVERFDAERLRGGDKLERLLDEVRARKVEILVGTQMLAKGHDFPALSLVGVVNADQALFSADFRAVERLGQLLTQVAGRAGRAEQSPHPAEVLIQTREPQNPQLRLLLGAGYGALAERLLAERAEAGLPPSGHLVLLRAEAPHMTEAQVFLRGARDLALAMLDGASEVQLLGPAPAPMERREGRYRAQLLLQASRRAPLHRLLPGWLDQLEALPAARRLRWSLDVDPIDLF
ncbi:primosomal protein N' [Stagnimonas aquatica]|uniref:Replication restart protein PriA n=1 Tax=Stagnimonas aquatica TaxID=2689987 RepID=A0A3N0VJY5_9GAMM|nr:primosomal protein N' [Stagnimonas aquatica]ROH93000.1 primosomal protein N' [Stagnimonas aquatica]